MRVAIAALCALFLAGCDETTKVFDKPVLVERAELILPPTMPINQAEMKWIIRKHIQQQNAVIAAYKEYYKQEQK